MRDYSNIGSVCFDCARIRMICTLNTGKPSTWHSALSRSWRRLKTGAREKRIARLFGGAAIALQSAVRSRMKGAEDDKGKRDGLGHR